MQGFDPVYKVCRSIQGMLFAQLAAALLVSFLTSPIEIVWLFPALAFQFLAVSLRHRGLVSFCAWTQVAVGVLMVPGGLMFAFFVMVVRMNFVRDERIAGHVRGLDVGLNVPAALAGSLLVVLAAYTVSLQLRLVAMLRVDKKTKTQ
eukprot:m51a1_g603 hypothetical protein (147) ;mRNA; f:81019-81605